MSSTPNDRAATPPSPGAGSQGETAEPGVAPTVLVVDDERNIRRTLELVLTGEGYRVVEASSAEEAAAILEKQPVELAIVDLMLPGQSGLELLEQLRAEDETRDLPVVVISGHATVHDAVKAIKLGASDFFEKPLNRDRIVVSIRNALQSSRLARQVADLCAEMEARYEMIGQSAVMQKLFGEIDRVAPTKASVLITGESGTGKELISRAIHRLSPRANGPFVKVNCAAIPRELIESELVLHEVRHDTAAHARNPGESEQGHGGTLFLDEIGDMEGSAQSKVLRALQSGEVSRVGGEQIMHVDVRVLAATNKDLSREVAAHRFREDLFFRLAVFPIRSPSLRERKEDIRALADFFMLAFCRENGLKQKAIDKAVYAALERRTFPGNVRELKNVIERAAILSGDVVTIADLPEDPHENPFDDDTSASEPPPGVGPPVGQGAEPGAAAAFEAGDRPTLRTFREAAERGYIVEVLASLDWNISRAAVVLGVERTNLHKKIRAYGIKRGEA